MRMTRDLILTAIVVVVAAGASARAGDGIFILATSQMDNAAQARYGKSFAEDLRIPFENVVQTEIRGQVPCLDNLTLNDAAYLMNLERMRQLLGGSDDPQALAAVAGAVGARYVVRLKWTMTGSNVSLDGTLFNVASGSVMTRQHAQFPYDDDAGDRMIEFAQKMAAAAGAALPKCPPKGWKGTVSFKEEFIETGTRSNHPYERTVTQEAVCTVEAGKNTAMCKSAYSSRTKETCPTGKACGGTLNGKGDVATYVVVDVANGKISIHIPSYSIRATGYSEGLGESSDDLRAPLGGYRVEAPASGDGKSQSGSKTVELLNTDKVKDTYTVKWALTRDW